MTSLTKTAEAKLQKAQDKRRFPDWQPKPPAGKFTKTNYNEADLGILERLLHFVDLEVSVGSWVASNSAAYPSVTRMLQRNTADELKHDEALRQLKSYVGSSEPTKEAKDIINQWNSQEPTFALAYALEMGVFMSILPWLNKNGDAYCSQVSNWISDDEVCHVVTNNVMMKEQKQPLTKEMFITVRETLLYIFEDINVVARAFNRLKTGVDTAMMNESIPLTTAFFEQSDKRTTQY